MASTSSPLLRLPVFAGQGTSAVNNIQTRRQGLIDASSPSGSILLSACYEAFHTELSSLLAPDFLCLDVELADFKNREALLSLPAERYMHNAVISGPTLLLIQALRYLAFVEATGLSTGSLTPFSDVLKRNSESGLGVLGFSSGILPACIVGTSFSTLTFVSRAVEAYRLALWIGIRSQLYTTNILKARPSDMDKGVPWSLVFIGMDKEEAQEAIIDFSKNQGLETSPLYITAITDDTCVTISGHPAILSAFSNVLITKNKSLVHQTALDALYHSPIHANGLREHLLVDVVSRNIQFPNFSDIKVPIRSTLTGDLITKDETSGSLLELVVDMILIHPVNWNILVGKVVKSSPDNHPIELLNVGPGSGLTRGVERTFARRNVTVTDLTAAINIHHYQNKAEQEPIAIIGMSVNMPGAPNTSKLWELLEKGINTISEVIPEHRFSVTDYDGRKNPKRTMKAHRGNFLDGVDEFDNKFFKISPREAKSMDPQQRILLHTAYEALEDSGYVPNSTPTSRPEAFGCYIGVATHDYLQNLRDDIDVYYSPGTLKAFLSGRISYAMQLSGPSIVVDTACSSSTVALYQGARALMNRDCDSAMVGGVNVISSPDMFLGLDRGHFLSPTGQCKAFDASADGYSRSEGCGIFVLKRLSDAIAENDRILGVIRGIEVNQSGLAHSITHPHPPTQAALFKRVLEKSNIDAHRVNVVEAHGTGTQAGDPSELESIRSVFALKRSSSNPLHITSVKANIGHLEAASGAAGLAKLLLMFQHQSIPRQISLKNLNPRIAPLESDNTVIDVVHTPWAPSHKGMTRVALLNNFGAAGSNTALLLEEHLKPQSVQEPPGMHYVFGLSAKDGAALDTLRSNYLLFLEQSKNIRLADVAYTSTARRQLYDHRIAVSASSISDLMQKLPRALPARVTAKSPRVVFVFSGQGGQYLGMGRSLYRTTPVFRQHIDECHHILLEAGFPGVRAIIDADTETSGLSTLQEFEAYQAAIFSLQYALAQLWIFWGLSPSAVVGHSLGEYAALVIAKVLSLRGALLIVANRVRLMIQKCAMNSTGMIAVNLGPAAVESALIASNMASDLTISCRNSPIDCVVSGPLSQLTAFKEYLDIEIHCKNILLSVPFGYHSPAMSPLLEDLTAIAAQVPLKAPTVPVVSNVLGEVILPGDTSVFNSGYFARHCGEPVQFDIGIQALIANPVLASIDAWIEIGPHTSTLPMLKSNNSLPRGSVFLGSLRKQQDPWETLTSSLCQLYASGVNIHWRNAFAHLGSATCVSLPSYPFSKTKYWVAYKETPSSNNSGSIQKPLSAHLTGYSILHAWTQYPSKDSGSTAIFETPIAHLAGWITGHSVGGMPLCPASIYVEQALAGIHLACQQLGVELDDNHVALRGVEFAKPLVYDAHVKRIVVTTITVRDGFGTFSVGSRVEPTAEESIHAHGEYRIQLNFQAVTKFARKLPAVLRHMAAVLRPSSGRMPEVFSARTAYEVIFPRVVEYSREYRTMQSLTVETSGMEGCAEVCLPSDHSRGKFIAHPVFMDTLLHVAGFVANLQGGPNDAYICSEVGAVKVLPHMINSDASYMVYCTNAWVPEDAMMVSEAYAVQVAEPRRIVAHLKGMQFRRVRLDRLKRSLAHAIGKTPHPQSSQGQALNLSPQRHVSHQTAPDDSPLPSNINGTIIDIVSRTCDITVENLDVHMDLTSLGVDSLMFIEIAAKVQNVFPDADFSAQALSFCNTIADIGREVSLKLDLRNTARSRSPATDRSGTSTPRTAMTDDTLLEDSDLTTDGEINVKQVLASILDVNVKDIDDDLDLESLGLDSLTSIEALHALKSEFALDLPADFFSTFNTARSVHSYVASHLEGYHDTLLNQVEPPATKAVKAQTSLERLIMVLRLEHIPIPIQTSNSRRIPLFLIHDGSGLVNYYDRLPSLDRSVWGVHNPRFTTSRPWDSVTEMAQTYADYIVRRSTGSLILGGWSFGGVVAYEIAHQLKKRGVQVQGILLIDSPSPINHVPLSNSLIDSVISLNSGTSDSELRKLVKTQFTMNAGLLEEYQASAENLHHCPPLVLLRSSEGFCPSGMYDVPLWLSNRSDPQDVSAGWESLAGGAVKVMDIPGDHFQPFHSSNIYEVSQRMAEACEYLEGFHT
ncbi:Non-reducing polyketide synthase terA [Hypsizygus marmoreus]|uniref:Non-reducing polyketide synthase terA n=1 Tax=Hypsizygus marmoreus TaxID=39966 RepID=A0A369IYE7_HYPMA|nr:Non-reducing polyketide synthase terA [Hypsizygus marmoreus]